MMIEPFNPDGVFRPRVAHGHAALVPAATGLLFISGQLGMTTEGVFAEGFAEPPSRVPEDPAQPKILFAVEAIAAAAP